MKKCSKCGLEKSVSEFSKKKITKDGLRYWCRTCVADYDKTRKRTEKQHEMRKTCCKKWRKSKKGKQAKKNGNLKRNYNLTLKQHEQMYVNQNGCCKCCGISVSYDKINTDHNHKTNEVRGLLCTRCNVGAGYIDDKEFLNMVTKYLDEN